jgi:uncharacterized RDD family membrane protein YckC
MPPAPPPPPPGFDSQAQPPAGPRPGELVDRFAARLIDGVLLFVVNLIIVSVIVIGVIFGSSGGLLGAGSSYGASALGSIITAAIYLGYFAYMESSQGRTIGKMIMKLRVVGPNGGNPTLEQAARRNIWMAYGIVGIVPIVGGLIGLVAALVAVIMIAVGINSDTVSRQAWHDKFAGGTRVIKEG